MITSQIRIPEELWQEIRKTAEKEERSINSQIIYIFKKFVEEQNKKDEEKKW